MRTEALNSKIQWIKYTARGFRSREGYRRAIYFHCGASIFTHRKARRAKKSPLFVCKSIFRKVILHKFLFFFKGTGRVTPRMGSPGGDVPRVPKDYAEIQRTSHV